jgi:succinoglycan biosynthesis protein ExoA
VTVLIPARNEQGTISECLESVLAQSHVKLHVVVVDGVSDDGTREIIERFCERDPRVQLVVNTEQTIPRALDLGLEAARGRWLVRVDAHSTIPKDYVERALHHLHSGRWGGVGGRKDAVGTTSAGKAIATVLGSPLGVGGSVYHHGTTPQVVDHIPFGAYPTDLVRELDGWDETVLANEDFEFDHRLRERGYELLFDPDLKISWRCRESINGLFRQYFRYGRGKARVTMLHPESLSARHIVPPAFTAAVGTAALIRSRRAFAMLLVPYLASVGVASAVLAPRLDQRRSKAWLPLVFPAMHLSWGLGFWVGLVSSLRNDTSGSTRAS